MMRTGANLVCRVLAALLCLAAGATCAAQEITVAAAADLQFALREIAQNYEKKTGHTVKLTFGSSGALAAQIQNGAPFDVFFSADASYPETLVKQNAADGATLTRYARGLLVLWLAKEQPMPASLGGDIVTNLDALTAAGVARIAIANPQHAPYGRAAVEAMQHAGVYEKVSAKLVVGENVSQAAQFAESGNAQAALLPLSLVEVPALKGHGHIFLVAQQLYSVLMQEAVVTSRARNPEAARDFLRYVTGTGMDVLRRHGFESAAEAKPLLPGGRK